MNLGKIISQVTQVPFLISPGKQLQEIGRRMCHKISHKDSRISTVLTKWKEKFVENSVPEPCANAEFIIAHVIHQKTLHNTDLSTCLTPDQMTKVDNLCKHKLDRAPVQYILGEWDFHDLTLKMKPPVLIPRPETEELAELCCSCLRNNQQKTGTSSMLEVGCGSGAITVLLLKRFTQLQAVAVDISSVACELTKHNASLHGVESRLTVLHGDFRDKSIQTKLKSCGPFSLMVSNPPYVTTQEMESLQPEICRYEDPVALHGGRDGFDVIEEILIQAPNLLSDNGHVWLETGPQHPEQVREFVSQHQADLSYVSTQADFAGKDRFCHVVKDKSPS